MPEAYLTIDDTPSEETGELCDWLVSRDIPALLFCRGDRLSENSGPVIQAIKQGFVIGNHAWSHTRCSQLRMIEMAEEISRTDELIDECYERADVERQGKYFRFPHMDRGTAGHIIDFDKAGKHKDTVFSLFNDGLNLDIDPPSESLLEKKQALQIWLEEQEFQAPPFEGITFDWYTDTEMAEAIDAMFTFSTSDWMLTPRHQGNWPYKTIDDLKDKIDNDPYLWREDSRHIVLAHDQAGLFDIVTPLLQHMIDKGLTFIPFSQE